MTTTSPLPPRKKKLYLTLPGKHEWLVQFVIISNLFNFQYFKGNKLNTVQFYRVLTFSETFYSQIITEIESRTEHHNSHLILYEIHLIVH